jgi:Aspartyl protease/Tetratricopeptide repeat
VTRRAVALVAVLALLAAAAPAPAADWSAWQRYMEAAERAWEQGRLTAAEEWLQDAVAEAERQDRRSPQLARSLTVLAEVYRKQGRAADARTLARRIAEVTRAAQASAGPDVPERLQAYATLLRELGRDADARAAEARVQRLREVRAGDGRGQLLLFNPVAELREYAQLLRQRNREAEARAIELQAAAEAARLVERNETLRRGYGGPAALPTVTWVRQVSAGTEALEGRLYPEAEGLFAEAVKTAETFGVSDARRPYTLSLLAYAARAQGKRAEFTRAAQRALPMLEAIAGTGHSYLPRSTNVLALAYLRFQFDGAEALAHFQRSLPLLQKDLPADHPAVGLELAGLAASYLALGQPEPAAPLLQRALAISEAQSTAGDAAVSRGLLAVVRVYEERGDDARADAIAERIVAVLRRALDPDHPDLVLALALRRHLQAKAPPATNSVPLEIDGNTLLVRGVINGSHSALFIVDPGATVTSVRPAVLQRLGLAIPPDAPRLKLTLAGGDTVDAAFVTLAIQIGSALAESLDVAVVDASPGRPEVDGLLGASFLQRFRVVADRSARRLTLEPAAR